MLGFFLSTSLKAWVRSFCRFKTYQSRWKKHAFVPIILKTILKLFYSSRWVCWASCICGLSHEMNKKLIAVYIWGANLTETHLPFLSTPGLHLNSQFNLSLINFTGALMSEKARALYFPTLSYKTFFFFIKAHLKTTDMMESCAFSYIQVPLGTCASTLSSVSSEKQNVLCTYHRKIQIDTILMQLLIKPKNYPTIRQ